MSDYSNLLREMAEMRASNRTVLMDSGKTLAQMRADRDAAKAELARLKAAVTADVQTSDKPV